MYLDFCDLSVVEFKFHFCNPLPRVSDPKSLLFEKSLICLCHYKKNTHADIIQSSIHLNLTSSEHFRHDSHRCTGLYGPYHLTCHFMLHSLHLGCPFVAPPPPIQLSLPSCLMSCRFLVHQSPPLSLFAAGCVTFYCLTHMAHPLRTHSQMCTHTHTQTKIDRRTHTHAHIYRSRR